MIDINSIKPNPRNPRKISKAQLSKLCESIKRDPKFMALRPIVVDSDMVVLGGNQRLEACKLAGMKELPDDWVKCEKDFTDEERKRFILIDNSPEGMSGEWDYEMLAEDWKIPDLENLGFNVDDFDLEDESKGGDAAVDPSESLTKKYGVQSGDLWLIGDHRLLCGDSTKMADVERVMNGEKAQICWTDPPWNVAYGKTDHPSWKQREIINDNLGDKFPEFVAGFCNSIRSVLLPGGLLYMAMSAQEWPTIDKGLREVGFHWSSTIIWAKDSLVLSRKDYHTQYEPIWYGWLDGASRLVEVTDRTQSDLWQIDRPRRSEQHPTMKPVELVERSLKNSSRRGNIVFEPFCGSGTDIVACQNLGRKCNAIEMSVDYCAAIIERMCQAFPGIEIKKA